MLRIVRSRRGTGLIDIMVTLALLSVAGIIFSTAYPTAFRCSRQSSGYKVATAIVQKKLEQMRGMNYESLTAVHLQADEVVDTISNSSPYSFTSVDALADKLTNGSGTLTVTDDSPTIRRVTVTVTWTDQPSTVQRSVSVTTLFTDTRTRKVS